MLNRRSVLAASLALGTVLGAPLAAHANDKYPSKPIRMVIPYGTGATTDLMGRLVAHKIAEELKQPVVVENKSGAAGMIGSDFVAKSAPDGYTFLLATDGTHTGNPFLLKKFPFHAVNDVTPIIMGARNLLVLVAHPSVPVKNVKELIDYAKKNKGKLSFGSSGNGSPHHMAGVLFNQMAGTDLMHVPYRGGGPAVVDVLGGQIPLAFASLASVSPHVKAGKLTMLGLTEKTRAKGFEDIPTIAESLPGFEMNSWLAFVGPANMDPKIVQTLNKAIANALNSEDVKTKLNEGGLLVAPGSSADFGKLLRSEYENRGRLIKDNNITIE